MAIMRLIPVCLSLVGASAANPIEQTIGLLTMLQTTITKDGDASRVAYEKYLRWCHKSAWDRSHEIKFGEKKQERLQANIEEAKSDIVDADEKIEALTSSISTEEGKLKAATEMRASDKKEFESSEKKLVETIAMVDKASAILLKNLKGKKKSFMQMPAYVEQVSDVLTGLAVVVDAAGLPVEDGQQLTALLQDSEEKPKKKAYDPRSGSILEILKGLRAKAETMLKKLRQSEKNQKHNFGLLKMELEDIISDAKKDLAAQKKNKSGQQKEKAEAEGALEKLLKQLKESRAALAKTQSTCMARAADHEQSLKTRSEELKALAAAKAEIQASLGEASKKTYSFLQVTSTSKSTDRKVISMLKKLANSQHSQEVAQLASRVVAVTRYGEASGEDPFKKVKGLIKDLIYKLQREVGATKKAIVYCKEAKKSKERADDLKDEIEDFKGKGDKVAAASVGIKAEVKDLQLELAELAKQQQEMDAVRAEQNKVFLAAKADLQKGIDGCRTAIKILRDYYSADEEKEDAALIQDSAAEYGTDVQKPPDAYKKSAGAGAGIIGLLEVIESDMAKSLAEEESEEDVSRTDYEKLTQENKVIKMEKDKAIEYKTQQFKALDKSLTEITSDKDTAQEELAAVNEYYAKVKKLCAPEPDNFVKRKQKRKKLINGLEQALKILQG